MHKTHNNFRNEFTTAITLENKNRKITIINKYTPPLPDFSVIQEEIDAALKKADGEALLVATLEAMKT